MYDPVGAFDKIRDNFLLYIKTAFGTKFPEIEQERETRLRQPGVFYQEPWIEPLPRYERSGMTIHQLGLEDVPGLDKTALEDFKQLAFCGLVGDYELYSHQVEMLRRALSGQNVVVTAGTGSGKTESFLLPLFAYLAKESTNWNAPGNEPDQLNDWWKNEDWQNQCNPVVKKNRSFKRSYRLPQRSHEKRDAAVRALILYPMNALVEDQLTRLRRALDSEEARKWFKKHRKGNRIYFGRYNGVTPVPGHEKTKNEKPNGQKIEELVEAMQQMELSATAAEKHAIETGDEDVRFFFPRLDGAEMRCRWDMQDAPPDILITNYCMLSIMLMRDADKNIFEKTKEWLKKPDSVFHLIVDELHLYRGTAGTEVAYLLRLLLQRLGLHPSHPKLRILASSASLEPNDPKSLEFLKQFFGAEEWSAEQIIPGRPEQIPPVEGSDFLKSESFIALATAPEVNHLETLKETSVYNACRKILESDSPAVGARMFNACKVDGKIRAVSITDFAKGVFGENLEDETLKLAARGLLIARGLCNQTSLPSFRLHWFFRNIEGLWACTKPNSDCHGHESSENRPVGRLFVENPPIHWGNYRVLELLYCEQCGTVFFGGNRLVLENNDGWELLPTEPDIEGIPDRKAAVALDRRKYPEFAVFWPSRDIDEEAKNDWSQPSRQGGSTEKARWNKASLDTRSGRVRLGEPDPDTPANQWVKGYIFHLPKLSPDKQEFIGALPSICPCCGADYSHPMKKKKSPVRGFRTGFSKVSQLLSKELFYQLPEDEESRKLVVFSDSREDAASISNGIERSHYEHLVREALFDELNQQAIAHPRLLEDIQNHGQPINSEAIEFVKRNPHAVEQLQKALKNAIRPLPESLEPEDLEPLQKRRDNALKLLNEIQHRGHTRTVPLKILFEGDSQEPGLLMQRLKVLGVNPAGNDVDYQEFYYDGDRHHWTTLFDFSSNAAGWKSDLSPSAQERRENTLREKVKSEVCDTVFSYLNFGIEASGLGYISLNLPPDKVNKLATQGGTSSEIFESICTGCLRIMGEFYRYRKKPQEYPLTEWTDWREARAKFRKYVEKCADSNGLSERQLKEALWSAIAQESRHHHFILDPRHLSVRVAVPDDPVWQCSTCGRPHLHRAGGICTNTDILHQYK